MRLVTIFLWLKEGFAWRLRPLSRRLRVLFSAADATASFRFLRDTEIPIGAFVRARLLVRFYAISLRVDSPHRQWEVLTFAREILRHPKGSKFVEAGTYKGSSAAKFSLAAELVDAILYVFDSFEGIPENTEPHDRSILGQDLTHSFKKGAYTGSLQEVQATICKYGSIANCEFMKGWFDDTMPDFLRPISGAYIDVDLVSSTKTCIQHLFPLLGSGDVLISQDGHIPLVIEVFRDQKFWRNQLGLGALPKMTGVGSSKIIIVTKD